MKYIELKDTTGTPILVNTNNILYCSESTVYDPSSRNSYLVTKIVFGNETTKNVSHSLEEVKSLIELV